ncbi:MAG: PIN domain-containing protein [Verrucomicrobia bacterium]|nr:PIN domain-containing protein [Verrucomicrobiota bacterium]
MQATHELVPPLNHVFVDFENVHHFDASVIGTKSVNFTLLLGAEQTKLDAELVEKLMEHAASVQLIRLTSSGKNALDFALANYVGRAVSTNAHAFIHIISKDKGFDPLIEHLRSRHIHAHRHDSFAELTFSAKPKVAPETPKAVTNAQEEPLIRVLKHLRKNVANRPKKKKTLLSHLKSQLGKGTTDADAAGLLEKLQKAGRIRISDKDDVTYHV